MEPTTEVQPESTRGSTEKRESQFARISSIILMIAILVVAGGFSAITAMRFAIRGKLVEVPELRGKTEEEARKILESNNLLIRNDGARFSGEIPAGRVVEQNPPAGTQLKTSRTVKVLVSQGDRQYAVPNLVGASFRAATLTLTQRFFTLGNATIAHTPKGEPSTVLQQSPQPGSQEGTDPKVNVLVSLGPLPESYIMPDFIGRSAELVASRARGEGFMVGKFNYRSYTGVGSGVVIQQRPEAGSRISKDEIISLDVSQ
jgi:serine/threonine-protein kinase